MTRGRDFRDLIGDDLPAEERARLERVHDLLVAAGPPPELPPSLDEAPEAEVRLATPAWLPRRRLRAALVLAAALTLIAFGAGYLVGDRSDGPGTAAGFDPARTVELRGEGGALAVVRIGDRDENGNRPMLVTVEGLERRPAGGYYTLFMTKEGKPVVTCGTFNVRDKSLTTVRLSIAYDFDDYDGLLLSEYRTSDHKDHPLLRARLS